MPFKQTQGTPPPDASAWRQLVLARLVTLDCRKLVDDVAPFLEHPDDAALLTEPNIGTALMGHD